MKSTFRDRVLAIVRNIPRGKTMTYGHVAAAAGSPGAARAVGVIMSHNKDTGVPCHRVVKADGTPGGYNGLRGTEKAHLLAQEKIPR